MDDCTDISTITRLIVYIKYLAKSDEDGKYHTRIEYLDLIVPSGTAIHMKVIFGVLPVQQYMN